VDRPVDDIDLSIIDALRADGRVSNKLLAAQLGISETTVASRIRGLRKRRVMLVTLQRDMFSQGYELQCFADVFVARRKVVSVATDLAKLDAIMSVSLTLGSPEIVLVFHARDRHDMLDVLDRQIAPIKGVVRIEMHIALDIRKYESHYADLSHL